MLRPLVRRTLPVLFALTAVPFVLSAQARPAKNSDKAGSAVEAAAAMQQTPDGALRAFLAAMIGPNPAILHQVTLPVSDADFRILATATPASDKDRATGIVGIASMQFHALHPGDVVALPGGRSMTVSKSDVDVNHVLLQMPGGPVPILVRCINNLWYVDAASIIAARKTAADLRRTLPKRPAPAAKHH